MLIVHNLRFCNDPGRRIDIRRPVLKISDKDVLRSHYLKDVRPCFSQQYTNCWVAEIDQYGDKTHDEEVPVCERLKLVFDPCWLISFRNYVTA